jgi:hypothetical protein
MLSSFHIKTHHYFSAITSGVPATSKNAALAAEANTLSA